MNANLTDITVVLDRSGSMISIAQDTIGGYNAFVATQREAQGDANLTLVQFDDFYEVVYTAKNVKEVPALTNATFIPRGWTALMDAIGRSINATGARLAAMPEDERPANVIFVIITDGEENKSKEFNRLQISNMIKHQTDVYNWDFVFLGANQDAIAAGTSMGFLAGNSMSYAANAVGATEVFNSMAASMTTYRSGGAVGTMMKRAFFSDEDRQKQKAAGAP